MNWELIISGFALLISGITAWYSYKQGSKSNNLQERVVALEEQREQERIEEANKAMIVPRMTTGAARSGKTKFLLSVFNEGQSEARNVRVFINGQTPTEYPNILTDEDSIEVIGPSNKFDFTVAEKGYSGHNFAKFLGRNPACWNFH